MLIAGSYVFAKGLANPPHAVASEEEKLLEAIASRDSDADGLADWAEALYGTDPRDRDTRGLGMTDGEAVSRGLVVPKAIVDVPVATAATGDIVNPDLPPAPAESTLTAAFSRNLLMLYMNALERSGGNLSDSDLSAIARQALMELAQSITPAPPFKSERDLTVSGAGDAAMLAFATSVERVMKANTANATTSEIYYLQDAVERNDKVAIARIVSIAKVYRTTAVGIAALHAPEELAEEHLALVNAFARMSEVTSDFARVESDPLITMLALQQYPEAVLALGSAFIHFSNEFKAAGITLEPGTPGASIVNLMSDIAAEQKAGKNLPGQRSTVTP